MTIIDFKNIIIGNKDYEEEFFKAYLSVISEERVEREREEKIARQQAIVQKRETHEIELERLRFESELHKLRLETGSIRSNVRLESCAEDPKKTSSNFAISIVRAKEHVREASPAVLMAKATIPVTTPIKEEKRMDYLTVVHVKEDQEVVNAVIAASAQIPMVGANEVEGKSFDNGGTIQITSAFGEHGMGELKVSDMEINDPRHGAVPISRTLVNDMVIFSFDYEGLIESPQLVRNPAMLRESSKEEGIINSTDSKSVCGQEVVTDQHPETYTQSLSNVLNENLVALEINASNVQTNGQSIKESKRKVAFSVDSLDSENNFILSLEVL
ncbi:hypothetical protein TNCV_3816251 [Trichonephila clavipes]|nr:hypothetical protein TNCV_3816251 [Trichonephila clavipes]